MHAPAAALLAGVALTTAPCVAATPASQAVRYWPGDATSDLHTGFTSAGMQDDMIVVDPEDVVEDFALVGTRKLLHGCHRLACDSGSLCIPAMPPVYAAVHRQPSRGTASEAYAVQANAGMHAAQARCSADLADLATTCTAKCISHTCRSRLVSIPVCC